MSDDAQLEALRTVKSLMKAMRPNPSQERVRTFTQETHTAYVNLFALMQDNCTALAEAVGDLRKQIKALEAREDAFKGVWQRAQSYRKGDFVTRSGSLWCALREVPAGKLPGSEPELWQLAAKGHG